MEKTKVGIELGSTKSDVINVVIIRKGLFAKLTQRPEASEEGSLWVVRGRVF